MKGQAIMKRMGTAWLALVLVLTAGSGPALAHGEKDQDQHKAGDAALKREQTAWGIAGTAKDVKRTIRIRMDDRMRFSPSHIRVREGETVKFVIDNHGRLLHEMVIGTKQILDEHAQLMMKFPNMEHDEPHMAHVAAGKRGAIIWTFNRPGDFDYACLIAGHYQAGMRGTIRVSPAKGAKP